MPHQTPEPLRIAVVGASPAGLASATVFAHLGHRVTLLDADPLVIGTLREGDFSCVEAGIVPLLRASTRLGRIDFTTYAGDALIGREIVMLATPAPGLEASVRAIAPLLRAPALLLCGREVTDTDVRTWLQQGPDGSVGLVALPADGRLVVRPVGALKGAELPFLDRAERLFDEARAFFECEMNFVRSFAAVCERARANLLPA